MKMILSWLADTRPDKGFEISQTAQVTWTMYEKDVTEYFKRVNKEIECVHEHKASFRPPKLD